MATVRHAPSGGLNVRSTPAGDKVTTLNAGDLMYDIVGVASVTKAMGTTTYVWIKVHYYKTENNSVTEGDGWVTQVNTTAISKTVPTKSDTFCSNSYLKQHEMLVNARYIYKYLKDKGWTSNAIYAVLGNMEAESKINPGVWCDLDSSDPQKAYGLVQWCPSTKLTNWLNGKSKSDIDNQLSRIVYESEHEEQWDSSLHSPAMSFADFIASTKTCAVLAEYFLRCYEHPGSEDSKVKTRQNNANKWKTLIGYLV